jgi:hypothetical protein
MLLRSYRGLAIFLITKLGLMYLMRVWIRKNLKDMEKRGVITRPFPR